MRCVLVLTALVALVVLLALPAAAQSPTVAVVFDYSNADFITYSVDHFEAQWDTEPWLPLDVTGEVLPDTLPESLSYRVVPPFTSGTHTVAFRACNLAAGCGGASVPFGFEYVPVAPLTPLNIRRVPR
jgi:hypothetical protein